jgi:hypothetical protein
MWPERLSEPFGAPKGGRLFFFGRLITTMAADNFLVAMMPSAMG